MHGALRHIALAVVVIAAFTAGQIVRDRFEAERAEASSVGGAAACAQGTGSLVCATSPTLTTPNIGVATGTRLTLTQGVSAVTGVFTNGSISLTGGMTIAPNASVVSKGLVISAPYSAGGSSIYGLQVAGPGNGAQGHAIHATGGASGSALVAVGSSASYPGINSSHASGVALSVSGDTTSPVYASIYVAPQDAEPTGAHLVGHMYVTSAGVLKICTVAGTPGTWVSVGAQ